MNRRWRLALIASVVVLSSAPAASAAPFAFVTGSTANFTDDGPGPVTDNLQVTISGGNVIFEEINGDTIIGGPGCLAGSGTDTVTCTPVGGNAVSVDIGEPATAGAGQIVTYTGAGFTTTNTTGGSTADTFIGAGGADTFNGGAGADDFDGGTGLDTVSYDGAAGAVRATPDGSPTSGVGCPATCEGDTIETNVENLTGSGNDDVLIGTAGANVLAGGGGNDSLMALAGADTVNGGAGNDTLAGGLGDDGLTGGDGSDTVDYSGDGRQGGVTVNLHVPSMSSAAADGDTDTLATVENATGTPFADTLNGDNTNSNTLSGLAGDDTMAGDRKNSATPNDEGNNTADVFSGGDGTDTVTYSDSRRGHDVGVTVTLDDQANDGGDANTTPAGSGLQSENDNVRSDVERVIGAAGNDTFTGSAAKNFFDGADGTNTVSFAGRADAVTASLVSNTGGAEGDEWTKVQNLTGGSGDDVLIGEAGANALSGGPGNDLLRGGLGNDSLNGGDGSDTADYSQDGRTAGVSVDLNTSVGAEDTGMAAVENAIGTEHADTLRGNLGNNTLIGLAGNDTLTGLQGDDVFDGGTGADDVNGGQGADTAGYSGRSNDVSVTLNGVADDGEADEKDNVRTSVESVVGGAGNDTITANAAAGAEKVVNGFSGGAGNDTLTSLGGADVLDGGAGSDVVSAGDDDDTLRLVDATADVASCGAGNDTVDADDIDVLSDCETIKRVAGSSGNVVPVDPSTISVSSARVREGNRGTRLMTFTVTLSKAQVAPVAVPYVTGGGTAKSPSDYTATAGTLTFAAGETAKQVTVAIRGDKRRERNETFGLGVANPAGNATVAPPGFGTGTIVNDDRAAKRKPRISAKVDPRRDATAPFRFVVLGELKRPKGVGEARGCQGRVRVIARAGGERVAKRTGFVDENCEFTVPVAVPKDTAGRVKLSVRFLGNRALKPAKARTLRARVG